MSVCLWTLPCSKDGGLRRPLEGFDIQEWPWWGMGNPQAVLKKTIHDATIQKTIGASISISSSLAEHRWMFMESIPYSRGLGGPGTQPTV